MNNFPKPHMTALDAAQLYTLFNAHGIEVWVDGGWAVDAVLGHQTRPHDDLDIALRHMDVPKLRNLLASHGYCDMPRDDTRECNLVLADSLGHQIDVHSFELDANGHNSFGIAYEAVHLTGTGIIGGCTVKCIPPEWLVKFHSGYALDENDYRDVKALCDAFDIPLPEEHKDFWEALNKNA